ncbi:MAG: alpha/beta fold hydrolase [Eubacteriaceae bacterium]|nr:alpha/beta fold hydrolase [Eubacteriaceae bacterium]
MSTPEIANSIATGSFKTNYHDYGAGEPVLLIHGSGPGVSSWANWGKVMPKLSANRRVLAIDMLGFGYTDRPEGAEYTMAVWIKQAIDFIDAMGLGQVDLVGNSFGGALAIALAVEYPEKVRKLVLMGSMGVEFPITFGLDSVWGYTPSLENMRALLDLFAYDREIINDDLAKMRYEASILPGFQESFSAMFPVPRQYWVESMARNEAKIPGIKHPALIIHGREDQVIPIDTSLKLFSLIEDAQLHIFGRCGHWTQIEHTDKFVELLENFLAEQ